MVLKLDAKRREKVEIQERTRKEMERAREEKERGTNIQNEHVFILNQELEILRLEFQVEQEGVGGLGQMTQRIDVNKSYCGCCCCLDNGEITIQTVSVRSSALKEFFHVNNKVDAERKMGEIKKRYEQLHDFGWPSCQGLMSYFSDIRGCMLATYMTVLPQAVVSCCAYNCYSCIRNGSYRMGNRTRRLFKVYQRFGSYSNQGKLKAKNTKRVA